MAINDLAAFRVFGKKNNQMSCKWAATVIFYLFNMKYNLSIIAIIFLVIRFEIHIIPILSFVPIWERLKRLGINN